ncbi:MAG: GNAT family N-acetyltransferase [Phototrophicaceae bacterium]
MNVQSFNTVEVFDTLKSEWNTLLKRSLSDTPFSSHEWHSNWWNAYAPGELWVITVRDDKDTLQGIAPLFIATSDEQRVVHFIGCEDVTDYVDVLVDKDNSEAVYQALADFFVEHKDNYDSLDLCNIPAESATYTYFPSVLSDASFNVETKVQEVCPLIELPDTFEGYLELLDKKQRKEVQRKLRRAKGAGDSLNWYIVGDEHKLDEEIEKFLKLMASSHPEKAKFLENDQHVTFFKSIVPAAAKAGWLQMNFLEVMGEPVAAYVNFDYNNQILVYNSGLEPSKAAALSPGIILLAYNIQHAIETKHDIFDFLRGDEQYKYKMGGQNTEIFNLKASL